MPPRTPIVALLSQTMTALTNEKGRSFPRPLTSSCEMIAYEHPLVEPQVSHLRQVPLRTIVKLPHSEQLSPS
jgi:hypothetical protein